MCESRDKLTAKFILYKDVFKLVFIFFCGCYSARFYISLISSTKKPKISQTSWFRCVPRINYNRDNYFTIHKHEKRLVFKNYQNLIFCVPFITFENQYLIRVCVPGQVIECKSKYIVLWTINNFQKGAHIYTFERTIG